MILVFSAGLSFNAPNIAMAEKFTPLNAGKTGIKSNAGGGNGTEDQIGATTEATSTTTTMSQNTVTTDGEPSVVSVTTTQVETGRVVTATERVGQNRNKPGNLKTTYTVTYDVYTTTGTETVKSTQTFDVTETTKVVTATTDVYDIDPGKSQAVNQAPEGEPDDIVQVVSTETTTTEVPVGDPAIETISNTSTVPAGTTTDTVNETTPCNNDQCN